MRLRILEDIVGRLVWLCILSLLLLLLVPLGTVTAQPPKDVESGSHDGFLITDPDIAGGFREYDRIKVEVTVSSGGPVDVYIMSETEYLKYDGGWEFKPDVAKEKVVHTTFTFENPDGNEYYLVIDNKDNLRSNDAVPTANVNYNYTSPIEERHNDVVRMRIWIGGGIAAGIVIVISIIVIAIIYKKAKRG